MDFKSPRFILACVIASVGMILIPFVHAPNSDVHFRAMRWELANLPPPPSAFRVRSDEKSTLQYILLERGYNSKMTANELNQYYRPLLQQNGWRLVKENVLRDLGRDLG